eukprot:IDg13395t1
MSELFRLFFCSSLRLVETSLICMKLVGESDQQAFAMFPSRSIGTVGGSNSGVLTWLLLVAFLWPPLLRPLSIVFLEWPGVL